VEKRAPSGHGREGFLFLKQKLCEAPILTYPRPDRPFILSVDAATGDDKERGGMGAVLLQADDQGHERVVAYASVGLDKHERNYSPFLLEMAACSWAIDHFRVYLKGRHFVLQTDHKPVENVSRIHKKTLNRLQEQMSEYSFIVEHKPGALNSVADALSRNATAEVASMTFQKREMFHLQQQDPLCLRIIAALTTGTLPEDPKEAKVIADLAKVCFIQEKLLRTKWTSHNSETRYPLVAPQAIRTEVLRAAHASRFAGHGGQFRTFMNVIRAYWWPGLQKEVNDWVASCPICQEAKNPKAPTRVPLRPLEVLDRPNVRIHCDLFGPARSTSEKGNRYILVMTDAFTKYAELVAIPNKEATTVAQAIMERWICRFSAPKELVTDQGREFLNRLSQDLFERFGISHNTTAAMHPAANSGAESFNREIARYMKVLLEDNDTLSWEDWLPMLSISYNTQVHKSIMNSPFFLTFLHDPNLPHFDMEESRPDYGNSWPAEAFQRLRKSYLLAQQHNLEQNRLMKDYYDRSAQQRKFEVGERVLVFYPRSTVLRGNPKFTPPWRSGCYIHEKVAEDTYWVRDMVGKAKGTIVHASRLKRQVLPAQNTHSLPPVLPPNHISRPNAWHRHDPSPPAVSTRSRTQQPQQAHLSQLPARREKVQTTPSEFPRNKDAALSPSEHSFSRAVGMPEWLQWMWLAETAAQQVQPAPAAPPAPAALSESESEDEASVVTETFSVTSEVDSQDRESSGEPADFETLSAADIPDLLTGESDGELAGFDDTLQPVMVTDSPSAGEPAVQTSHSTEEEEFQECLSAPASPPADEAAILQSSPAEESQPPAEASTAAEESQLLGQAAHGRQLRLAQIAEAQRIASQLENEGRLSPARDPEAGAASARPAYIPPAQSSGNPVSNESPKPKRKAKSRVLASVDDLATSLFSPGSSRSSRSRPSRTPRGTLSSIDWENTRPPDRPLEYSGRKSKRDKDKDTDQQ
jgi:transposase InsO family protein